MKALADIESAIRQTGRRDHVLEIAATGALEFPNLLAAGAVQAVERADLESWTGRGGVEAIASALAIKNNIAPPTINLENPDPECDLDYVPNKPREMKIDVVMSNSLGFGGHNATLLFKRYIS